MYLPAVTIHTQVDKLIKILDSIMQPESLRIVYMYWKPKINDILKNWAILISCP